MKNRTVECSILRISPDGRLLFTGPGVIHESGGCPKREDTYGGGLTQKNLAEKLFMTDKAVSKWECGYSNPSGAVGENKKVV